MRLMLRRILRFAPMALLPLVGSLTASRADAFPDMIRHDYSNCNSCHVSPTGGGVLTNYGRELIPEVLSTWSAKDESKFAYGLVPTPAWLKLGGDFRTIQTYRDTPYAREGKYFLMQADVEAAAVTKYVTVVATAGRLETREGQGVKVEFNSRRHYLLVQPLEKLSVRFGRFVKAYGINFPDHAIATKKGLGWDQGTEGYNAEAAWIGDTVNLFLTGVFGRLDRPNTDTEKGLATNASVLVAKTYKLGYSYFDGKTDNLRRVIHGPWITAGITPKLSVLAEWDMTQSYPEQATPMYRGDVFYGKLGYEFVQGVQTYWVHETSHSDAKGSRAGMVAYGPGMQWTPRPHIVVSGQWEKMKLQALQNEWADLGWLMFHYYL